MIIIGLGEGSVFSLVWEGRGELSGKEKWKIHFEIRFSWQDLDDLSNLFPNLAPIASLFRLQTFVTCITKGRTNKLRFVSCLLFT